MMERVLINCILRSANNIIHSCIIQIKLLGNSTIIYNEELKIFPKRQYTICINILFGTIFTLKCHSLYIKHQSNYTCYGRLHGIYRAWGRMGSRPLGVIMSSYCVLSTCNFKSQITPRWCEEYDEDSSHLQLPGDV